MFLKAKGYFQIVCTDIDFYFICFCFNTLFCFVLGFFFWETCWFTPVSENIDCIYKYIYHSPLFASLAFDMGAWLHLFNMLFLIFLSKYTKKKKKSLNGKWITEAHTARRYDCLSHTVLNKGWDVVGGL